ncbi:phosphoribosyltransferase [Vagococcus luciliae]|uniref:Phosphoribosyltransferase domain-containing protein n=1 Tax=Vagococcus luciliae TaxID=2920380 RepID=A0ABY5P184_9ENTE|nr:phosphoribosyltransferase [Vagococcus luciliae]UUV99478.1 hypothetical protein G314FT_16390 [Vagococcus luciliae]
METNNKLIIMSKLFLFSENNELIVENLNLIDSLNDQGITVGILSKNNTLVELQNKIPSNYKEKILFINRGKQNEQVIINNKNQGLICALVGVVEADALFAFHCKIPLFNPEFIVNRIVVADKVKSYGLPFWNFIDVVNCLVAFENYKRYYFGLFESPNYYVYSLINANTFHKPEDEVRIKEIFQTNLKGSQGTRNQKILLLLLFMLMGEVTTNSIYEEINYWGTFPSSKRNNPNTSAAFIKESVRCILGKGPRGGHELFLRHTDMPSKHSSGNNRLNFKCDKDFDTLVVNPQIAHLIRGNSVCIIDDYITKGYSAETAKHLLLKAGARKVVVLSIGKFGQEYFSTQYQLLGDITQSNYQYNFVSQILNRKYNSNGESFYTDNDSDILSYGDLIF